MLINFLDTLALNKRLSTIETLVLGDGSEDLGNGYGIASILLEDGPVNLTDSNVLILEKDETTRAKRFSLKELEDYFLVAEPTVVNVSNVQELREAIEDFNNHRIKGVAEIILAPGEYTITEPLIISNVLAAGTLATPLIISGSTTNAADTVIAVNIPASEEHRAGIFAVNTAIKISNLTLKQIADSSVSLGGLYASRSVAIVDNVSFENFESYGLGVFDFSGTNIYDCSVVNSRVGIHIGDNSISNISGFTATYDTGYVDAVATRCCASALMIRKLSRANINGDINISGGANRGLTVTLSSIASLNGDVDISNIEGTGIIVSESSLLNLARQCITSSPPPGAELHSLNLSIKNSGIGILALNNSKISSHFDWPAISSQCTVPSTNPVVIDNCNIGAYAAYKSSMNIDAFTISNSNSHAVLVSYDSFLTGDSISASTSSTTLSVIRVLNNSNTIITNSSISGGGHPIDITEGSLAKFNSVTTSGPTSAVIDNSSTVIQSDTNFT